ncbi:hypothetical protein CPLU01_06857 [Colletotrichum plurivorum]|uniref:Uncharacterized protein n=1 Tax=Colletotrichum plurivorum TaxID=2175906 RepID=A0A8H6KHS6_9PEZI|nr:hypothetical protein CPLU01_06857 [Colletotrichum plurivorum]
MSEAEGPGEETGNNTNGRSTTKKQHPISINITTLTKKKCHTIDDLGLRPGRRPLKASSPFPPGPTTPKPQSHRPHEPFAPVPDPSPSQFGHRPRISPASTSNHDVEFIAPYPRGNPRNHNSPDGPSATEAPRPSPPSGDRDPLQAPSPPGKVITRRAGRLRPQPRTLRSACNHHTLGRGKPPVLGLADATRPSKPAIGAGQQNLKTPLQTAAACLIPLTDALSVLLCI